MLRQSFSMAIARGALSFNIGFGFTNKDFGLYQLSSSSILHQSVKNKTSEEKVFNGVVTLEEGDFEEKFIRGSGPGGQKINKTSNCVELKHKTTGLVLKCQETRSLSRNREIARSRLLEKLRVMFTPTESQAYKKMEEKKQKQSDKLRKRRSREEAIQSRKDL